MKRLFAVVAMILLLVGLSRVAFSADCKVVFSGNGIMSNEETPDVDLNKVQFNFSEVPDNFRSLIGKVLYSRFTHTHWQNAGVKGATMYVFLYKGSEKILGFYVSVTSRYYQKTYPLSCSLETMECRVEGAQINWKLSFNKEGLPQLDASDGWSASFQQVGTLPEKYIK